MPGNASPPSDLKRIVVFDSSVDTERQLNAVRAAGGRDLRPLGLINAVATVLPDAASERALASRFDVVRVDEDLEVHAHGNLEIPWGVERVMAPFVWDETTGVGVNVGIIDTGIQRDHPDLTVSGGFLALTSPPYHRKSADDWDDDNGHGTHVAGTVAAYGAIAGVAPDANLYAVKVLDKNGSGSFSSVIAGIDWCVDNGMHIANMSLGASSGNDSLREAIEAADEAGLILIASAGNSGPGANTIGYPAAYPQTIAVAASDSNDNIASWSSRGGDKGDVDLTAPGVSIKSTWTDSGYRTISGTSMAAPHVTGVAALVLDYHGPMDPQKLWTLLTGSAEDLGHDFTAQGYGLVRADEALGVEVLPADPEPAFFAVSNLDPAAVTLEPGTPFTVSADVTNTGDESGTQTVSFQFANDSTTLQTTEVTLDPGGKQPVSFDATAPGTEGSYNYSVSSEDDSATGTLTVEEESTEEDPGTGSVASVASIDYSTRGGRFNDRHLDVAASVVNDSNEPVAGATVSIVLYLDGNPYASSSATTGSNGVAGYSYSNAPGGLYTTTVLNVVHDTFEWDGVTPPNGFEK